MSPAKKTTRKTKAKKTPARRKAATGKKATPTKGRATKKKTAQAAPAKAKTKAAIPEKKPAAVPPENEKVAAQETAPEVVAPSPPPTPPASPPADAHPRLGVKHTCFRCGAKFYDLFRPEPLCPKCGADQREAPKIEVKRKPAPPPKRAVKRSMVPLLDDEDEEAVFEDLDDSILDLEAAGAELDDPTDELEDEIDL